MRLPPTMATRRGWVMERSLASEADEWGPSLAYTGPPALAALPARQAVRSIAHCRGLRRVGALSIHAQEPFHVRPLSRLRQHQRRSPPGRRARPARSAAAGALDGGPQPA